jgi:ABC-2 type transport system permease protein
MVMLKLMKYEFRKQAFSKMVILLLVGLIQLFFFFGIVTDNNNVIGTSMGILAVFTFGALFFMAFEAIITFSNDLKQKCSYMLFLTPHTSYSIVGAKVLAAAIQIILAGIAFFLVYFLDIAVLVGKFNQLELLKEMINQFLQEVFSLNIQLQDIIGVVAVIITAWISVITVAFFSITLSTTFLANFKLKGLVSFLIFIAINYVFGEIVNMGLGRVYDINNLSNLSMYYMLESLYMLCFTIITYVGTSWMLEKKVSV